MKTILMLLALTFSTHALAASGLTTLDAYKICPNLRSYVYGYNINPNQVDECIDTLEANKFQKEPAQICLNLPHYSHGFYVTGYDVINCFKHIANKTFSENRLEYCKNIKFLRNQNGQYTSPSTVYSCLK